MVCVNKGLPDPSDTDDNLSSNNEVVILNDTDSDDDINEYNGYQPLALGPEEGEQILNEEDDPIDAASDDDQNILPPVIRMSDTLVFEVWSSSSSKAGDIEMDKDKENEVKQAMVNFTLPSSSIPEWANNIPEEEWKGHLMRKLEHMNRDSNN